MRLLASTDIALRVLMLLAREVPGGHLSVDVLAHRLGGLSRHHLHKIVQDLTALGVTRTVRGAGGGVLLARPADQIRLGAVIRQLESDQPLVNCFRPEGDDCVLLPACRLRNMFGGAERSFYDSLDQYTLADCLPVTLAVRDAGEHRPASPTVRLRGTVRAQPRDTPRAQPRDEAQPARPKSLAKRA